MHRWPSWAITSIWIQASQLTKQAPRGCRGTVLLPPPILPWHTHTIKLTAQSKAHSLAIQRDTAPRMLSNTTVDIKSRILHQCFRKPLDHCLSEDTLDDDDDDLPKHSKLKSNFSLAGQRWQQASYYCPSLRPRICVCSVELIQRKTEVVTVNLTQLKLYSCSNIHGYFYMP